MLPNFIIAGVGKAATSALFEYLKDHPDVCGSSLKETNFFTRRFTGDMAKDRSACEEYFKHCPKSKSIVMEATPSYLGGGKDVARNIKALLPEAKLLFNLRNPVDRLYSHYNYNLHVTPGYDASLSFDDYVDLCMRYSSGEPLPQGLKIKKKRLVNVEIGRYAVYLKEFYELFPRERVKVMFYEELRNDVSVYMRELCGFLSIEPSFYDDYSFERVNVTPTVKSARLKKTAHRLNKKIEKFLPNARALQDGVVNLLNMLDGSEKASEPMSEEVRAKLTAYYAPYNEELKELLGDVRLPEWV